MDRKKVVVLGAGPAGLACAMYLMERPDLNVEVTVLEANSFVGGISSSFSEQGLYFDYGSHRLHPHSTPEVLEDIKKIMGTSLKLRPRNGRIGLNRKFVKFPLNPINLATQLSFGLTSNIIFDMFMNPFNSKSEVETYSSVLLKGVGPSLCNKFYFPYARKIWGLEPTLIDGTQAHRRVSANSFSKTLLKVFENLPGIRRKDRGVFYYPEKGYGQISDKMAQKVLDLGGKIKLKHIVNKINVEKKKLSIANENKEINLNFDFLFSTIPMKIFSNIIDSDVPPEIKKASKNLKTRSMVLIYFIVRQSNFTNYDAHYFPEEDIIFSRMSEPKIYSDTTYPEDKTGICFEVPCNFNDKLWNMNKLKLANIILRDLKKYNFPSLDGKLSAVVMKRVKDAYPIYNLNFNKSFKLVDDYLSNQENCVSLGRQGLFAHDNLHHTMEMASCGVDCLDSNFKWDKNKWNNYRVGFEKNVVVD